MQGDSAYSRPVLSYAFCINKLHKREWLGSVLISYIDTSRGDSMTLGVLSGTLSVNEHKKNNNLSSYFPLTSLVSGGSCQVSVFQEFV